MKVRILDRQRLLGRSLRSFLRDRLLFALSRFSSRVEMVTATVRNETGPQGDGIPTCRIVVRLRQTSDVSVTQVDTDLRTCVARAAERVGRAVRRAVDLHEFYARTGVADSKPVPERRQTTDFDSPPADGSNGFQNSKPLRSSSRASRPRGAGPRGSSRSFDREDA